VNWVGARWRVGAISIESAGTSRKFVVQQELTDIKKAGQGPAFLLPVKR
jgi:hypothetical protein